jgi:geranylgeranyl diphosphate synthase, type II
MLSFIELRTIVETAIQKLDLVKKPVELYEPIHYTMSSGGKRLRPVLVLAAYNLFRDDIERALSPALAIELFHNFTLLHDDIMDKSEMRRNQPTVHKKWSENVAILSGDAMLIKAYELMLYAPQEYLPQVLGLFTQTSMQVCEGQQFDMNFEDRADVSEDEYIEMISLKTSVLLAASLKIGALCAGAGSQNANHLYRYGLKLGLAFQLQDDYLDAFGDPLKFGKKIGGDIVARKKTYLLIKALELADAQTRDRLNQLLHTSMPDNTVKIDKTLEIYRKLEIPMLIKQKMDGYYKQAMDALGAVDVEEIKKAHLIEFSNKLMVRER